MPTRSLERTAAPLRSSTVAGFGNAPWLSSVTVVITAGRLSLSPVVGAKRCAMRILGYILLVGGFVWLAYDGAIGFTDDQYIMWIRYSKTKLPPSDPVARRDAVGAMRGLSLDLKNRHRLVIVPGVLMLAGGLVVGIRRQLAGEPSAPNRCTEPPPSGSVTDSGVPEGRRSVS
jgi:hypothetical protein